jgi:hypothetical protein
MSNRVAAIDYIVKYVNKILPNSENGKLIRESLEALSDTDFASYMDGLETGEEVVPMYVPNLSKARISIERNLEVAAELKHDFFQRLWWTDPITGTTFLTNEKYLVIDLPLRRQVQLLQKKYSIPDDNKHVDELTGQPAGVSKGSRLSFPEIQVLYAQGLDRTIEELIKYRGGDTKAFNAMNRSIVDTGGVSLDAISVNNTKVKSTQTLSTYLKAMHLANNL